jgi:hypothetical protein
MRLQGFTIIEEQGRNLGLSVPVVTLAKSHYREIHKRKTIIHNQVVEDADTEDALEREKRERFKRECVDINRYSQPTIVTACVFLAIRREKTTHTLKEILGAAKKWSVARKELNRFVDWAVGVVFLACVEAHVFASGRMATCGPSSTFKFATPTLLMLSTIGHSA